ncbi:unnamed protein product [Malus baccata var. baccata]
MDYNNDNEHWNWRRNNQLTQKDSNHDMSECMWKGVPQNEEDISYMFDDETTPVKACGDLAYHVNFKDDRTKEPEPEEQSFSQIKRRRMLQFDTQDLDPSLSCDELSSSFLNTNERLDSIEEAFSEASQWVSGFAGLDQSPDEWIAECFNNTDMHFSPDELNFAGASDVQLDVTKLCDLRPEHEVNVVQQRITRTPQNVIFKGTVMFVTFFVSCIQCSLYQLPVLPKSYPTYRNLSLSLSLYTPTHPSTHTYQDSLPGSSQTMLLNF